MTHYVPAFAPRLGDKELSLCEAWVDATQHSAGPSCQACRAIIAEEDKTARALEAEFPEFRGKL